MTLAGNECSMQANLTHYDHLAQLEDDIVSFLPTVSDIKVFGCKVDFSSQIRSYPCQRISMPRCCSRTNCKLRVPINPRKEIADRAFYAGPFFDM